MRWGVLVLAALWTFSCHTLLGRVISLLVICSFLYWLAPSQHPIKQQITRVLSFNSREEEEAGGRKKHKRNRRYLCTDRFNVKKIQPKVDTVVIGSGMSGLTCAAVLSRYGRRVLVLEQHTIAGGGTHSFDLQGFRFDAGLHYTVPWSVPLFHLACGPRYKGDNAELEKIPTFARLGGRKGEEGEETFDKVYLWNEGSNEVPVPFLMKHGEKHLEELYKLFPKEKAALDAYLKLTDRVMFSLLPFAISKLLPLWLQKLWWKLCLGTFKTYGGRTAKEVLGELTDDSRLVALLCGLWIDTGTRPDRATFFLTASVFRGLAKEGAVYPEGGSETMARCLVDVIEANGGKVLTRASVSRILVEHSNGSVASSSSYRVTGVLVNEEIEIPADLIVSSAGYHNTFGTLLPEEVVSGVGMPRCVPGVGDSAGFVMCNVGIRGNSRELNIPNCNLWVHPVNRDTGDMFGPLEKFFSDPLAHDPLPAMITFPSLKDRLWETKHSDKMSCQILVMADHAWYITVPLSTKYVLYTQTGSRSLKTCPQENEVKSMRSSNSNGKKNASSFSSTCTPSSKTE